MIKLWTSYFYQIRNFPNNIIPLSTAVYDPKWFHNNKGQDNVFRDRRGVYNGFRISPLVPGPSLCNLCRGNSACPYVPWNCEFLRRYRQQLDSIDFDDFMRKLDTSVGKICNLDWFNGVPEVAFIFHEAPDKACSERVIVTDWIMRNGLNIEEWSFGSMSEDIEEFNRRRANGFMPDYDFGDVHFS